MMAPSMKPSKLSLVSVLLLVQVWSLGRVAASAEAKNAIGPARDWETLYSGSPVSSIAAFDGHVFAATRVGLFVHSPSDEAVKSDEHDDGEESSSRQQKGTFDSFFEGQNVKKVWLRQPSIITTSSVDGLPPAANDSKGEDVDGSENVTTAEAKGAEADAAASEKEEDDYEKLVAAAKTASSGKVFVISEGVLYERQNGSQSEWRKTFPEGHEFAGRNIVDITGNDSRIVFLVEYENEKKKDTDSTTWYTLRSDVYLVDNSDVLSDGQHHFIGSFPASQVHVDATGGIYTYGDIYGFHGASVGVSTDGGNNWRHSVPQISGKNGQVFAFGELIVATSNQGNLVKSYDKGRSWKRVTQFNGLPSVQLSAVLVSGPTVFVATTDYGLYISTNEGDSFEFHSSLGNKNFPSNHIKSLALDPVTSDLYVGFDDGLAVKREVAVSETRDLESMAWYNKFFYDVKIAF